MAVSEAKKQNLERYRYHDIHKDDITERHYIDIRSNAINKFVYSRDHDQVKLIVSSFMDYLTANGYRITKDQK